MNRLSEKPHSHEYPPYADMYIKLTADGVSVTDQLKQNCAATVNLLAGLSADVLTQRYAPGKWNIKEIVCHLSDDERIYTYRALRFARSDRTELPGFDQDLFASHSHANNRTIQDLLAEFSTVREATLSFFNSVDDSALLSSGLADGNRSTVRALAFHIAGHELHHVNLIRQHYLHPPTKGNNQ